MIGVKNKKVIGVVFLIVILISIASYFFYDDVKLSSGEGDFEIKNLFLKINLNRGGSSSYDIDIENMNKKLNEFLIDVKGLTNFISVDEKIVIDFNEEKTIKLDIEIPEDTELGVYLGSLEVALDGISKSVPIILEIESEDILFDANIDLFPKGRALVKGEQLSAEIKLFDLVNVGVREIEIEYFIGDFEGRTIVSEKESKVIDGKLDYSKNFEIPKKMDLNEYALIVVVKYQNSAGVSSVFFNVVDEEEQQMFEFGNLFFIVILFLFFFVIFIVIFGYYVFYRDRLFGELQKQYKGELRRQKSILLDKEKCMYSKLKTSEEKMVYKKEIEEVKKKRFDELREIHRGRVKKMREIKRRGKGGEIKKKLNEWKKKGYDTDVLEKKYKVPEKKDIQKKINEWKKRGYDTGVLNKK